jgi:squalene-hopene/tetraprenyl-beta-curcumene cyclase
VSGSGEGRFFRERGEFDSKSFTLTLLILGFSMQLASTIAATRAHLLSLRNAAGHWEGELSSSALSTATAVVALTLVDSREHEKRIADGVRWLIGKQNADGGWGDTTISKTNLSTTLLCWSALSLHTDIGVADAIAKSETWIRGHVGSLEPEAISKAVVARYGKDKTFSVPILMTCAIGGRMGGEKEAWRRVLPLPFELAALPRDWFGAVGLPVVSYALPALIAIGYARYFHARPAWWNPLGWLRGLLWPRISPMLKLLQPSSGGYLEATPLTSFVTMALASADEKHHPCVSTAVEFLIRSQRADGAWPIDTNLATWATTLSTKALYGLDGDTVADHEIRAPIKSWLLAQQYRIIHPFTNAAPGGWAWTDLPGGVPDADDTSGALIALWHLCNSEEERRKILPSIEAGITWLLDLQNRDGGMPTFCRGWGALPFDRSTPEITAHTLWGWWHWKPFVNPEMGRRLDRAIHTALIYLHRSQRADGSWIPLWFGNEHAPEEENPAHGTAMVLLALSHLQDGQSRMIRTGAEYLCRAQHADGGWGGASNIVSTIEETANAVSALAACVESGGDLPGAREAALRGAAWLCQATQNGTVFPSSPIGLYFARLWYHEKTYPILWTLAALQRVASLKSSC